MTFKAAQKRVMRWGILLLAIVLCLAGWVDNGLAAKDMDYEVYELGQVTVSADKTQTKQVAVVTEVTAEDIKATNSRTVAEALSYAPGILVSAGRKNEPSVNLQGFQQYQVQVLIDGVPYYEAKYQKLDLSQIPTDNIAKIEIIKGGASVLYGANALGGVINIVTKKATTKPFTSLTLELGNRDTERLSFSNGTKQGIFSYWFNYTYRHTNGWELSDDYIPRAASITYRPGSFQGSSPSTYTEDGGLRDNTDSKDHDVWLKFGMEPNKDSAYFVNLHYLGKEKGVSPSTSDNRVMSTFSQFAQIPIYEDWGIDLDGKQKISDPLTLKMKLFYHNHMDEYDSYKEAQHSTFLATSRYKDYVVGGSLVADYKAADWDSVRTSFHYKKDSHKERSTNSLPFDESIAWTGSVGLENEFTAVKNLSVVMGVSYDWFHVDTAPTGEGTTNDGTFNPMIGLNYAVTGSTNIFGSVAQKTRFPNLNELYSGTGGNDALTSEKSINYTLGASHAFGTLARAEASLFYHDISDRISRDNPINPLSQYQNYASTEMYGFEVTGEVYPIEDLTLRAGYTYNYAQDKSPDRVTDEVTNAPKHKFNLGAQYRLPAVKTLIDLNGTYVSSLYSQLPTPSSPTQATQETGDYFLVDGKVTQPFMKYFEIYGAVKNIFDKNYEPEYGWPGAGRMFWVGLTAKY
jgi:iron complex outermembrane receptor protein